MASKSGLNDLSESYFLAVFGRSLGRNANLRSAMDLAQGSGRVRDLARCATRLRVPPKHIVVEGGSAAEDHHLYGIYIVYIYLYNRLYDIYY